MSVESKLFFPQPIITPIITRLIFFSPTFPDSISAPITTVCNLIIQETLFEGLDHSTFPY